MTFSVDSTCLPDVNVWIAIAADEHHATAGQWFDTVSVPVCFCRVTQMAFLRLLTNPKVMGEDLLRPVDANRGMDRWPGLALELLGPA
jgi:predicted nucleic acid-binding protein